MSETVGLAGVGKGGKVSARGGGCWEGGGWLAGGGARCWEGGVGRGWGGCWGGGEVLKRVGVGRSLLGGDRCWEGGGVDGEGGS